MTERKKEELLVLRAQSGDLRAFDELLRRHERALFVHIHRMVADEQACYDILQESYISIFRSIKKLRKRASWRAWAYGVATRTSLKWLSRHPGRREHSGLATEPVSDAPLPDVLAAAHEELGLLEEQVELLSPKLRAVVLLHYLEGLTLAQVAAALELSLGTVKSRLHSALVTIRRNS